MDGIAAIQGRIAEIQGRFGARPAATNQPLGSASSSTSGTTAAATSFEAVLAAATGSGTGTGATTGNVAANGVASGAAVAATGSKVAFTAERTKFAQDLLARLGITATPENVKAVVAWQQAEGTKATFNPLATTQRSDGATTFNYAGVKNYLSYQQGLDATVKTITNGRYGDILAALRAGTSATEVADAIAKSPWGTGEGVLRVLRA